MTTATSTSYPLSLHDALPIYCPLVDQGQSASPYIACATDRDTTTNRQRSARWLQLRKRGVAKSRAYVSTPHTGQTRMHTSECVRERVRDRAVQCQAIHYLQVG